VMTAELADCLPGGESLRRYRNCGRPDDTVTS
jgi:hypothetical protein